MVNDYLITMMFRSRHPRNFSKLGTWGVLFCFCKQKGMYGKIYCEKWGVFEKSKLSLANGKNSKKIQMGKNHFEVRINNYERVFIKVISSEKCGIG